MFAHRTQGGPDRSLSSVGKKKSLIFRLRYLAVIVICAWAAYDYMHVERPQIIELQVQHKQLESQLTSLKNQQQSLQKEKQQLNSKSFIEKYATEHNDLVMPNQIPFNLQKGGQNG